MKKALSVILKISAGIIVLILILLFTIPVLFKQKIKTKVEESIAASFKASVKFEDYSLGFFKDFPSLSFSLSGLSVVGVDKFDHDTLASVKSFDLVFNLLSLFKKTGYEVKSILIDKARINAIVHKDGSVNWDISRDTAGSAASGANNESSNLKIRMQKVALINSSINYLDAGSDMQSYMNNVNLTMTGDMTMSETDMQISGKIAEFTFIMQGMKYLNRVVIDSRIDLLANLDKMKFTFRDNFLSINDLKMTFSGVVLMPANVIETDVRFNTMQTSFSSLLSLIPAVYMKDYKDLKSNGEFVLSGTAKGIYSDADSTMPDVALSLSVTNGTVSYPSLPEQIKNINISSKLFLDGKVTDRSTVDIDKFHMELAGSPFDMTFYLRTPVSDPDFKGFASGKIDLTALSRAVPMDSINLSGVIDMAVNMAGRISMIEKGKYEDFKASGNIGVRDMAVAMKGYPAVKINRAAFEFTPAFASLTDADLIIGSKSDFELNGRLGNYIPYFFRNQTLRGNLSLHSKLTDASQIMSEMVADTTVRKDTSSLTVIRVPKNIDFDFDALIEEFRYGNINAEKVKGHLIVRNGVLSLRETGMNILNGTLTMNGDYDTRDTLKPVMKADMEIRNIGIKDAFKTFNTVKTLAPAAKGIDGKISVKLSFGSLLGSNMMPVIKTISGEGNLKSDEITLVESGTFDKVKQLLKLGDNYNNTFRNVNVSFKIEDGRIYVRPFDVKTGNLKMNISGDQGLDQTINYFVKTEMPRSDLGGSVNALIDNLAAQAAAFGITYKPADVIKVNMKVSGTFTRPVISPVFGNASVAGTTEKESVTKEAVNLGKEKARAEAEKQADELVREAEEKGQQLRDEAAKAAESIRKEADARAKKLVDDNKNKSSLEKIAAQQGAEAIRKGADKKANQLVNEADVQSKKLVEEAKTKGDEIIKKI
jgi:vacuolar-type H+-ATPase subunit H